MDVTFATTVKECASTLANYSVEDVNVMEGSSSRTSWLVLAKTSTGQARIMLMMSDGLRTGCIHEKGVAIFKEFALVLFASGDFGSILPITCCSL